MLNKLAAAIVLSLLSFRLAAQNVLEQTNNISADYMVNYQAAMNSIVWTLLNGSAASMKALTALSNNQLTINYLQEQSKKFKAHFRPLQDGGRLSLQPINAGTDKWCVHTYFTIDNTSAITYFLQLKAVFIQANPTPVSRLKIGDEVPAAKIKYIKVLDSSELALPNSAAVYEAFQESDMFMKKVSSPEFQQMMNEIEILRKSVKKK